MEVRAERRRCTVLPGSKGQKCVRFADEVCNGKLCEVHEVLHLGRADWPLLWSTSLWQEWTCSSCTFINGKPRALLCEICWALRFREEDPILKLSSHSKLAKSRVVSPHRLEKARASKCTGSRSPSPYSTARCSLPAPLLLADASGVSVATSTFGKLERRAAQAERASLSSPRRDKQSGRLQERTCPSSPSHALRTHSNKSRGCHQELDSRKYLPIACVLSQRS